LEDLEDNRVLIKLKQIVVAQIGLP